MTVVKNLGQVSAIYKGDTPPTNTDILWRDTSLANDAWKFYDTEKGSWEYLNPTSITNTVDNTPEYNPLHEYIEGGQVYTGYKAGSLVVYQNIGSLNPQYQVKNIYLADKNINQGVSPENDTINWIYKGETVETISSVTCTTWVESLSDLEAITGYGRNHTVGIKRQKKIWRYDKDYDSSIGLEGLDYIIPNDQVGDGAWIPFLDFTDCEITILTVDDYSAWILSAVYYQNKYVSYINLSSLNPQYQTNSIYRSLDETLAGQSPETNPELWKYLGQTYTTSTGNLNNGWKKSVQDIRIMDDYFHGKIQACFDTKIIYIYDELLDLDITPDNSFSILQPVGRTSLRYGAWKQYDVFGSGSGGATNLSSTPSSTNYAISSSSGTGTTLNAATDTLAGVFLPAEKTKLIGIETGAQVNDANTTLQGNTFNGVSQLTKTDGTGKLPITVIIENEIWGYALSDQKTDLTHSASEPILTDRVPYNCIITKITASLLTAGTGARVEVDIHKNGTTILSTKLSFDLAETTTETSSIPYVLVSPTLLVEDVLAFYIDAVGSVSAGKGLIIKIFVTK